MTSLNLKIVLLKAHNFIYRIFGILLYELEFDAKGELKVVFSLQGLIASVFWSAVIFYSFLATNLEDTTGITNIYSTQIAGIGDFFQRILNIFLFPAIFLPAWFGYSKRKMICEFVIEAEMTLRKMNQIKNMDTDENWAVKQHLGQIGVLFACYAGYTFSLTYLLEKMDVAVDNGKVDYRLVVTTYATYLYAFLAVMDLVSSICFVVRRLKLINKILNQFINV